LRLTIKNLGDKMALNDVKFEGGVNIAIKIPKNKYEQTISFYKNILKLDIKEKPIENPTVSKHTKLNLEIILSGLIVLIIILTQKSGWN
jgi:hypothetical protein